MKKIVLGFAALLLLFAAPALAISNDDSTGPEGPNGSTPLNNPHFQISITAANKPFGQQNDLDVVKEQRKFIFPLADGWDFGDRAAYRCAWVEYFQGMNEKFEVSMLAVDDYPNFVEINDKYGLEANDGDPIYTFPNLKEFCRIENALTPVTNPKTGVTKMMFFHDGTDHFPHMVHPGDGIQFYQDGEPLTFLNLEQPACAKLYFTPGNEPGEAWLWWDEDGPTFSHGPGEGDLGCGGGPLEPVAIIRFGVRLADPDIGYCTVSQHEEQCFNVEPPPTPVQLGSGASVLTCPDSTTPVVESTEPLLVRCA